MKFDIVSLGDHLPDPRSGTYNETQSERFRMWVELGVRAESLGFDRVLFGEHHGSDYIISSPQMILAAIAAQTRRIRLGTAVSLLPNNDPVRLAEDFATLDLLSEGRAEIGFGSGFTEHTFRLFGQDMERSVEIADENLSLLQLLWNEHEINWTGKFRAAIERCEIQPRTHGGRALPISRATATSLATARNAGLAGHRLMLMTNVGRFRDARPLADAYRQAYREAGHDAADMSVAAVAYVHVRENGDEAREFWRPYVANYRAFTRSLLSQKGATKSIREAFSRVAPELLLEREADFVGSPEEVCEKIHAGYEEVGGFDRLICYFDLGGLSRGDTLACMNLFTERVLDRFAL